MSTKVNVILQARTGSKRLYGKSVIPVINEPLVVLCNKRLKDSNLKVTTIIPKGKEDNYLAYILKKNKLNFFRGNKFNVLDRFKKFTKKFKDSDIIVRVTADNPFVDGKFLNKLITIFKLKNLEYLSASDNIKNLPYGIQAEIFRVKHLRDTFSKNKYVLEHVTPDIKKKYLDKKLKLYLKNYSGISKLRLSIDTFEDLERVQKIFNNYSGGQYLDLKKIIKNKKKIKKKNLEKISKVVLGTVQLGKKYFEKNVSITQGRADKILKTALKKKINYFDTAHDYGNAEKFIGNFKKKNKQNIFICSKLKNLKLDRSSKIDDVINKVNFSIFQSLNKLNCSKLENFLIHNPQDLFRSKKLYDHIIKFLNCGIIKSLGVSIYSPNELKKIKKYKKISCVQLPFNLIDYRWVKILNKKNNKLKVFARSIFLRGNLKKNKITFPYKNKKLDILNNQLKKFCYEFDKKNFFELTFSYLKSFLGINYFVIGAQKSSHIDEFEDISKVKQLNNNQKQKIIRMMQANFDVRRSDLRNWN